MRLSDRVAVVTGAGSGIGAACAARFSAEGARVAGIDVQVAGEHDLAAFHEADVRDEARVAAVVAAVAEELGTIDVLVNAAGVSTFGAADQVDAAEWDRVLDINLKGTWLVSKHVLPHMIRQRRGSIVHLASVEGVEGHQMQAAYNASKGGVVMLTRSMAVDYGPFNVRVNCLCPGLIETPMTDVLRGDPALREALEWFTAQHLLGRPGRPEEVAAAALFLASDDASFVTGHALAVDGGMLAGRRMTATS